jgi:UPF0716 protein FxsA
MKFAGVAPRPAETRPAKVNTMFLRFLLLFAMVPLAELWLLVWMTERTSLGWTILLVISTGMIGMSLVRWQGMKAWQQVQQDLAGGKSPSQSILSGVLILVAGAFLLTPGLITDTAGFLLLIPQVLGAIAAVVQKKMVGRVVSSAQGSVWVSSFSSSFPPPPMGDAAEDSGRPSVRVIDPSETGRLTNEGDSFNP